MMDKQQNIKNVFGLGLLLVIVALSVLAFYLWKAKENNPNDIRLIISPYQDLAMIINLKQLELENKYGTQVKISTVPWQDTYAMLASASGDVDIAFAGLTDFLSKEENINKGSTDPIVFIFPLYVFKGGAFVTFKNDISPIYSNGKRNEEAMQTFLQSKMGLSKNTLYQMLVYRFANESKISPKSLRIVDINFDDALLAAQHGDIDVCAVGLTQLAEAKKRGAKVVFEMDEIGFADITGFMCKKSTLENKRQHIENLTRMWFDCTAYVMADIDNNSKHSLEYLRKNAATKFSLEEYKMALSQEFFPLTANQAIEEMVLPHSKYSIQNIYNITADFITEEDATKKRPSMPSIISLKQQ